MAGRVIFHIDVNSAFLSWTAAYRCLVLGRKDRSARDPVRHRRASKHPHQHRSRQEHPGEKTRRQDRRAARHGPRQMSRPRRGRAGLRPLRLRLAEDDRPPARSFARSRAVFHRRGVGRHDRHGAPLRPARPRRELAQGPHPPRAGLHGQHRHLLQQAAGQDGRRF